MTSTGGPSEREIAEAMAFLRRYVQRSMGLRLRRHESPSDIVQSALREFLSLAHVGVVPPDLKARPRNALLARLALRKIVDRVRYHGVRMRRRADVEAIRAAEPHTNPDDPAAAAVMREKLQRLEAALAALPPDQRDVVVLYWFEQLPHAEIAARMQRSVAASKMLLSRAMANLARLLGNDGRGDGKA
jgi:RNA polymerase sigma factor (sigma-70 family)